MEYFIDEAVKTQQTLELKELRTRTNKAFRRLTGKPGIRNHFVFLAEKDWRDKLCWLT
jgi:Arc/MetJ family transcription regulator